MLLIGYHYQHAHAHCPDKVYRNMGKYCQVEVQQHEGDVEKMATRYFW